MLKISSSSIFLRRWTNNSIRFLSSGSSNDESGDKGVVNAEKLLGFFKQAEAKVAQEAAARAAKDAEEKLALEAKEKLAKETKEKLAQEAALLNEENSKALPEKESAQSPEMYSDPNNVDQTQKDDVMRRFSTAPRFVPWTSNRLLKEYKLSRSKIVSQTVRNPKSFATLLRESSFVQVGNFNQREVVGVVIENANDSDLYVDFGGKFLAVVSQPENSFYPRGSLVRLRLRDPEMANRFMVNTRGISLLEADATLIGPYRGQLTVKPDDGPTSPALQSNRDALSLENWKL